MNIELLLKIRIKQIEKTSYMSRKNSYIGISFIILIFGIYVVRNLDDRISNERGKWKDIILKSKTIPLMVTYSPSYLIRFPENKKYSWEDLKKIKDKIQQLKIKI